MLGFLHGAVAGKITFVSPIITDQEIGIKESDGKWQFKLIAQPILNYAQVGFKETIKFIGELTTAERSEEYRKGLVALCSTSLE